MYPKGETPISLASKLN